MPSLTPFFESESAPGVFFAGNCTRGARGLVKNGIPSRSSSVFGFRYNARLLADELAHGPGWMPVAAASSLAPTGGQGGSSPHRGHVDLSHTTRNGMMCDADCPH